MSSPQRLKEKQALEELHSDLVGRPWPGRRYPGCYEVIQLYAKKVLDRDLKNFSGLYTSFKDEAVAEENGLWITKPTWGEPLDFSVIQENDLLLYKIYTDDLGGGYSAKLADRAPNHGAVYLGNKFILHQVWQEESRIDDLTHPSCYLYQTNCIGVVRENTT
tara:strand:- start:6438 stop:6923 length:486 start_codon:yes stop_codon:yes gene_type:complete